MGRSPKDDQRGYAFIVNQYRETGKQPSLQAIADHLGYAAKRSAQLLLERLSKAGRLYYEKGVVTLVHNPNETGSEQTVSVPLVGSAPCGMPLLAEQNIEGYIKVSTELARPGHSYFLLRAKGNSMNNAGIEDGSLALVRQQSAADQGDRVVGLINDHATIKRFYLKEGRVVLRPDSTDETHEPIILSGDFQVQGKVINSLPDPFEVGG